MKHWERSFWLRRHQKASPPQSPPAHPHQNHQLPLPSPALPLALLQTPCSSLKPKLQAKWQLLSQELYYQSGGHSCGPAVATPWLPSLSFQVCFYL